MKLDTCLPRLRGLKSVEALKVTIAATGCFALIYSADEGADEYRQSVASMFQWASITAVLVSQPMLGSIAKTGFDRCLGSFVGAATAMAAAYISVHAAFFVPCTAVAMYSFDVIGTRTGLGYAKKICMLSYLLVAGACLTSPNPFWQVATFRNAGIIMGVIVTTVIFTLCYPNSHTSAAVQRMHKALESLLDLAQETWPLHVTHEPALPAFLQQRDAKTGPTGGSPVPTVTSRSMDISDGSNNDGEADDAILGVLQEPDTDEVVPVTTGLVRRLRTLKLRERETSGHGGPAHPSPPLASPPRDSGEASGAAPLPLPHPPTPPSAPRCPHLERMAVSRTGRDMPCPAVPPTRLRDTRRAPQTLEHKSAGSDRPHASVSLLPFGSALDLLSTLAASGPQPHPDEPSTENQARNKQIQSWMQSSAPNQNTSSWLGSTLFSYLPSWQSVFEVDKPEQQAITSTPRNRHEDAHAAASASNAAQVASRSAPGALHDSLFSGTPAREGVAHVGGPQHGSLLEIPELPEGRARHDADGDDSASMLTLDRRPEGAATPALQRSSESLGHATQAGTLHSNVSLPTSELQWLMQAGRMDSAARAFLEKPRHAELAQNASVPTLPAGRPTALPPQDVTDTVGAPTGQGAESSKSDAKSARPTPFKNWDDAALMASDEVVDACIFSIFSAIKDVNTDIKGTAGEFMFSILGYTSFLPKPVSGSSKVKWHRNHFPVAAFKAFVKHLRLATRLLWTVRVTLRAGFSRDMLHALKETYPASLMHDLRHYSTAAIRDIVAAFPRTFVHSHVVPLSQKNLRKFIASVEALVMVSKDHLSQGGEDTLAMARSALFVPSPSATAGDRCSNNTPRDDGHVATPFGRAPAGSRSPFAAGRDALPASPRFSGSFVRRQAPSFDPRHSSPEPLPEEGPTRDPLASSADAPEVKVPRAASAGTARPVAEQDERLEDVRVEMDALRASWEGQRETPDDVGHSSPLSQGPPELLTQTAQPSPDVSFGSAASVVTDTAHAASSKNADAASVGSGSRLLRVWQSLRGRHSMDSRGRSLQGFASRARWLPHSNEVQAGGTEGTRAPEKAHSARFTPAVRFAWPNDMPGYVARVRWHAFQRDVSMLAEELMYLHQATMNVILHLPGYEDPGEVDPGAM